MKPWVIDPKLPLLLGGSYLVGISVVVAIQFMVNPWYAEHYDPQKIWFILDIMAVVAAVFALAFNTYRKLRPGQDLGAEIAFYATIGVSILLLHSWFSILALGLEVGDHQGFIKWAAVDVVLPIVFGATGVTMWIETMRSED